MLQELESRSLLHSLYHLTMLPSSARSTHPEFDSWFVVGQGFMTSVCVCMCVRAHNCGYLYYRGLDISCDMMDDDV